MMIGQITRHMWKRTSDVPTIGAVVVCTALMVSGCQFGEPAPYRADPLLQNHQASHHSHHGGDFARLPLQEPLIPHPPSMPVHVGAAHHPSTPVSLTSPTSDTDDGDQSEELPAPKPTQEPEVGTFSEVLPPPMPLEEVTESTSFKGIDAGPGGPELTAPRQVPGNFGKGSEYEWLQGVVDRHYRGHVSLRYQRPSEDDVWGGKVNLLGEEFLAGFESGDVIYVEGELRPNDAPDQMDGRSDYPGYRIRGAWLIKRRP